MEQAACYDVSGLPGYQVPRANIPTIMDDLVALARAGDVGAFEDLYRQHSARVYALCLRMSKDPAEATELAQQAFVRAWEKLPQFRGDSAFSSWLHRLTVNVVLGEWRSRRRRPTLALDELEEPAAMPAAEPTRSSSLAIDLERAIAGLPDGARVVFVLHDVEGYKHREIAEMTGLAQGTSKAQLHRARRLLRKSLVGSSDHRKPATQRPNAAKTKGG